MSEAFVSGGVSSSGSRCASGTSSARQNGSYLDIQLSELTFVPSEITIARTDNSISNRFLCAFKQKTGSVTGYFLVGMTSALTIQSYGGSIYKEPYYGNKYIMRLNTSMGGGTSVFWIAKE